MCLLKYPPGKPRLPSGQWLTTSSAAFFLGRYSLIQRASLPRRKELTRNRLSSLEPHKSEDGGSDLKVTAHNWGPGKHKYLVQCRCAQSVWDPSFHPRGISVGEGQDLRWRGKGLEGQWSTAFRGRSILTEFEASLIYIPSYRAASTTQWGLCLKKKFISLPHPHPLCIDRTEED